MKTLAKLGLWVGIAACSVGCLAEVDDPDAVGTDPYDTGAYDEGELQAELEDRAAEAAAHLDGVADVSWGQDADDGSSMAIQDVTDDLQPPGQVDSFAGEGNPIDDKNALSTTSLHDEESNPDPTPWEGSENPDPTPWRHPWSLNKSAP